MKKILSILLVLCLMASFGVCSAFAVSETADETELSLSQTETLPSIMNNEPSVEDDGNTYFPDATETAEDTAEIQNETDGNVESNSKTRGALTVAAVIILGSLTVAYFFFKDKNKTKANSGKSKSKGG